MRRRQLLEHFFRLDNIRKRQKTREETPIRRTDDTCRVRKIGRFLFRVLELLALLIIFPTAYIMLVDLNDRQSQRISQAWQLVTTPASGNSGKIQALDYLNSEDCVPSFKDEFKQHEGKVPSIWQLLNACSVSFFTSWPWKESQPLTGINLSTETHGNSVYLINVNLSGAELFEANLSGAQLFEANLSRAQLTDANLSGAQLTDANLSGAQLPDANLAGAQLTDANLSGARLSGANLSGARLSGANLAGARLLDANLAGAQLLGANLAGAKLLLANLSGAELSEANLAGANLSGATFIIVPEKHATLNLQPMPSFLVSDIQKTGAYYYQEIPPKIDSGLIGYLTSVYRGQGCTWFQGMLFFECREI